MKKSRKLLFAIPFSIMLGTCILVNRPLNVQKAKAEEPISVEVVNSEEPTSEVETISESDFVINVDEEVSKISQGARDFIECVRAILNQPIVIGGVSSTSTFVSAARPFNSPTISLTISFAFSVSSLPIFSSCLYFNSNFSLT